MSVRYVLQSKLTNCTVIIPRTDNDDDCPVLRSTLPLQVYDFEMFFEIVLLRSEHRDNILFLHFPEFVEYSQVALFKVVDKFQKHKRDLSK